MAAATGPYVWGATDSYEAYIGRWSRPLDAGVLALQQREYGRAAHLIAESLQLRWDFGDKWNIARVLEAVAAVLLATDRPDAAARVFGTIEALRETIDSPLLVLDKAEYDGHRAAAQAALGNRPFSTRGRRGVGCRSPRP
jgi:hypothetical protein